MNQQAIAGQVARGGVQDVFWIGHAHGKRVFMHSDGHITAIIGDLIELGLDALNSQIFCMGVEDLGRRFRGEPVGEQDMCSEAMRPENCAEGGIASAGASPD